MVHRHVMFVWLNAKKEYNQKCLIMSQNIFLGFNILKRNIEKWDSFYNYIILQVSILNSSYKLPLSTPMQFSFIEYVSTVTWKEKPINIYGLYYWYFSVLRETLDSGIKKMRIFNFTGKKTLWIFIKKSFIYYSLCGQTCVFKDCLS